MKLSSYIAPLLATALSFPVEAAEIKNTDDPTLQLSTDSAFNFGLLIALGGALTGGSDIAPVLSVARNIKV